MADFVLNGSDLAMVQRLQSFIPEKVFDAHAHLHNIAHIKDAPQNLSVRHGTATAKDFLEEEKQIYGQRKLRALFLPLPTVDFQTAGVPEQVNAWILQQVDSVPDCAAEVYVKPGDTREYIESLLINPRVRGFKCYYFNARTDGALTDADIGQYLPQIAWEIANERGLVITVHLVKNASLADPENLTYIKEKTAKYPNAKLILAHCARGFASWTAIEALRQLKGIDNIYYDLAAICEPATMFETIRQAGHDKVLWGTDYCISKVRARAISCAQSFTWLFDAQNNYNLLCLESLFAFYQTSLMLDLSRQQIEDIFYNNAVGLLGLDP